MDREDVIRMAKEAELIQGNQPNIHAEHTWLRVTVAEIERFAALVAAAEREKVAKIVDDTNTPWPNTATLAAAIRALT